MHNLERMTNGNGHGKRALVVGGGAIGSVLAASLWRAGVPVEVLTKPPEAAEAAARDGFTVGGVGFDDEVTMTPLFTADAARLADEGIGVYEIRPGIIQTDMTGPVKEKYDKLIAGGLTPIRRWGQPEDIGKAVVAIARGLLPFSTGEVINVDGGFHMRRL